MQTLSLAQASGIVDAGLETARSLGGEPPAVAVLDAGGRALAQRTSAATAFFAALTDISAGRIVPVAGGVLICDSDGHAIGAVRVSGDHPEKDEVCAVAGIARAGLKADVG